MKLFLDCFISPLGDELTSRFSSLSGAASLD